jgi:hypothetical protein
MNFNAKELIQILKACKNSNVGSFSLGDLSITFLDKCGNINQTLASDIKIESPMESGDETETVYKSLTDEDERELTVLNDPAQFERAIYAEETQEAFHIGASPTL